MVCGRNFSEFLKSTKYQPMWIKNRLNIIYHEIKYSKDYHIKKVIKIINSDMNPVDSTSMSILYLTEALRNKSNIGIASFRVIISNYIDIAKVIGDERIIIKIKKMIKEYKC